MKADRHTIGCNSYKASPLVDDPQDAEHNEYCWEAELTTIGLT